MYYIIFKFINEYNTILLNSLFDEKFMRLLSSKWIFLSADKLFHKFLPISLTFGYQIGILSGLG